MTDTYSPHVIFFGTLDHNVALRSVFRGATESAAPLTPFEERLAYKFYRVMEESTTEKNVALIVALLPHPTADHPQGYYFEVIPAEVKIPMGEVIALLKRDGEEVVVALDLLDPNLSFGQQWPHPPGTIRHPANLREKPVIATPIIPAGPSNVVALRWRP